MHRIILPTMPHKDVQVYAVQESSRAVFVPTGRGLVGPVECLRILTADQIHKQMLSPCSRAAYDPGGCEKVGGPHVLLPLQSLWP